MELHENLYALGVRLGRGVFDDPETFRGALDDFLDEDSATTGDINLLVDAVRLGGFTSMTSMIGSGARPVAAVEEAGARLARDRGSADVAGARWACAVLGFAIGKVSDAEVRRYRTQHTSPQQSEPAPTTQFPEPLNDPPDAPRTERVDAPVADVSAPPGGPATKRRAWPLIAAAAVAVAVVAGVVAVVANQGGDGDGGAGGSGERAPAVQTVSVDLDSVRERYSGLAGDVTVAVRACEAGEAGGGVSEVLECGYADGTLTLTTYESRESLDLGRSLGIGTWAGTRYSKTDVGVYFDADLDSPNSEVERSSLYWDSTEALQSATYVASSNTVELDRLVKQFEATDAAVGYPTAPEDAGLVELASRFVDIGDCERIQTLEDGELEESYCTTSGDVYVYIGAWDSKKDFTSYRRARLQQGADEGNPMTTWSFDGQRREGAAAQWTEADGRVTRYWDRPGCLCYMEAHLDSGDAVAFEEWWTNA